MVIRLITLCFCIMFPLSSFASPVRKVVVCNDYQQKLRMQREVKTTQIQPVQKPTVVRDEIKLASIIRRQEDVTIVNDGNNTVLTSEIYIED